MGVADRMMIVEAIHRYSPDWEPPQDTGQEWIRCLCPFHGDDTASASVSYQYNALRCHGCGAGGSAVRIIKEREGVSFGAAKRIAETIAAESGGSVSRRTGRKSGGAASRKSWPAIK